MLFKIPIGEFVSGLSFVSSAVSSRALVDEFQNIQISTREGKYVDLRSFNGELALEVRLMADFQPIGGHVSECIPTSVALKADKLVKYFNQFSGVREGYVLVGQNAQGSNVVFKVGPKSKLDLPVQKVSKKFEMEYPEEATIHGSFALDPEFLAKMSLFRSVVHRDRTKPATCVIRVLPSGTVWIMGSATIFEYKFRKNLGNNLGTDDILTLSLDLMEHVSVRTDEEFRLQPLEGKVLASIGGYKFFEQIQQSFAYPEVSDFLRPYRKVNHVAVVSKSEFIEKFRRLASLATDLEREIAFVVSSSGEFTIRLEMSGLNVGVETLSAVADFDLVRYFDVSLLAPFFDALEAHGDEKLKIFFSDSAPGAIFKPMEDCHFLVLPFQKENAKPATT